VLCFRAAAALVAIVTIAGCAAIGGGSTAARISAVDIGMAEAQVLSTLGQPRARETYGGTSFLLYGDEGGTTIPIGIVDGRVTSIGRAAYDVVVRSQAQTTGSARR
jgi:hypothetical protein